MTESHPETVCGVCGCDTWVISAATLVVALSRSWETSAWSLDSLGVLDLRLGVLGLTWGLDASGDFLESDSSSVSENWTVWLF